MGMRSEGLSSCPRFRQRSSGRYCASFSRTLERAVLARDFNLHPPVEGGGGQLVLLPYTAASQLVDMVADLGLSLATPLGLITRSFRGQETTSTYTYTCIVCPTIPLIFGLA